MTDSLIVQGHEIPSRSAQTLLPYYLAANPKAQADKPALADFAQRQDHGTAPSYPNLPEAEFLRWLSRHQVGAYTQSVLSNPLAPLIVAFFETHAVTKFNLPYAARSVAGGVTTRNFLAKDILDELSYFYDPAKHEPLSPEKAIALIDLAFPQSELPPKDLSRRLIKSLKEFARAGKFLAAAADSKPSAKVCPPPETNRNLEELLRRVSPDPATSASTVRIQRRSKCGRVILPEDMKVTVKAQLGNVTVDATLDLTDERNEQIYAQQKYDSESLGIQQALSKLQNARWPNPTRRKRVVEFLRLIDAMSEPDSSGPAPAD